MYNLSLHLLGEQNVLAVFGEQNVLAEDVIAVGRYIFNMLDRSN